MCFGGFLSVVSKPLIRTDESKENDILQEKFKQMIDQWKKGKHEFQTYNLRLAVISVAHDELILIILKLSISINRFQRKSSHS